MKKIALFMACLLAGTAHAASPFPRAAADLAAADAGLAKLRAAFARRPVPKDEKARVKAVLAELREEDVFLRRKFAEAYGRGYSREELGWFMKKYDLQLQALDKSGAAVLKPLLEKHGWFDVAGWGTEADESAWLIVQHADTDLPFQKAVLAKLEPLSASGGTNPSNYAMLWDRVAVREQRPQRYGSQGGCAGPKAWEPDPIEAPESLDARRAALGLVPFAAYKAANAAGCEG